MLRTVGRGLRRIFRKKHVTNQLPEGFGHASAVLASHLAGVPSSFIWCGCSGDFLKPIVHENGNGTELVALTCLDCGGTISVNCGVLDDGNAPDPDQHSIH
jgi:hypothetical protein